MKALRFCSYFTLSTAIALSAIPVQAQTSDQPLSDEEYHQAMCAADQQPDMQAWNDLWTQIGAEVICLPTSLLRGATGTAAGSLCSEFVGKVIAREDCSEPADSQHSDESDVIEMEPLHILGEPPTDSQAEPSPYFIFTPDGDIWENTGEWEGIAGVDDEPNESIESADGDMVFTPGGDIYERTGDYEPFIIIFPN